MFDNGKRTRLGLARQEPANGGVSCNSCASALPSQAVQAPARRENKSTDEEAAGQISFRFEVA
jgi:hypothetical protein